MLTDKLMPNTLQDRRWSRQFDRLRLAIVHQKGRLRQVNLRSMHRILLKFPLRIAQVCHKFYGSFPVLFQGY